MKGLEYVGIILYYSILPNLQCMIYVHIYIHSYICIYTHILDIVTYNPLILKIRHLFIAPLPRKQLWEVNVLPANLMNAPAIYQGSVFTSDTSGGVRAVSMQTGKPVWFTNTSKAICQDNGSLGHVGPWLSTMTELGFMVR